MASETALGALSAPTTRERGRFSPRGIVANPARLTGVLGLAAFVLIIVGAFVSPPLWEGLGTAASGSEVGAFWQLHSGRIIASLLIYSFAMGFFLCFAAGLWDWLRERERPPHLASSMLAFGAVALTVMILAAFVPAYMLSYRTQPAAIAGPLGDLTFGLLALSGVPTAICLWAYAAVVLRRRCLPVWTAWLAICGALAHELITASFLSHGDFLSLEGSVIVWVPATFFAWILATSVVMLRSRPG
jgi:hypothetical protein